MTDYLNLAKELSRKHCLTIGGAMETLADILQEATEAERAACKAAAITVAEMADHNGTQWERGWFEAATRISEDIGERK